MLATLVYCFANYELDSTLVHRRINNESLRWSDFLRAQTKKPQRSPLRLRFFICTLEKPSSANELIIYSSMY